MEKDYRTEFSKKDPNVRIILYRYFNYLKNSSLPSDVKKQMMKNAIYGVDNIDFSKREIDEDTAGYYEMVEKNIVIPINAHNRENYIDILIHEVNHAASTNRDLDGNPISLGVKWRSNQWRGTGLNEGITEGLADEIIRENGEKPTYTAYPELVSFYKEFVDLYGKDAVISAYMGKTEKLAELMEKDGKSYSQFLMLSDDYYGKVYNNEYLRSYRAKSEEFALKAYLRMGNFVEDIKEERTKRNPSLQFGKSYWKDSYYENGGRYIGKEVRRIDTKHIYDAVGMVSIKEDLSGLYGKDIVSDACFKYADELNERMAKDGQDYEEFRKMLEDYYNTKGAQFELHKVSPEEAIALREKYIRIGQVIEQIKDKRQKENPGLQFEDSQWKTAYVDKLRGNSEDLNRFVVDRYFEKFSGDAVKFNSREDEKRKSTSARVVVANGDVKNDKNVEVISDKSVDGKIDNFVAEEVLTSQEKPKNRLFAWFKTLKDKITGRFKKEDEVLFLEAGNKTIEADVTESNEFLDSIRVDESEKIYTKTQNEKDFKEVEQVKEDEEIEL